ncbi:hypothetical protein [Rhodopirellula sp. MGV]|uniref:hypothetical protein n=1 Tax=Rhodopirellula sp. MGV TaxID=2023130 RepID=UPI000B95E62B|nr:hypothetical protein [Rhodopirellula sp. MGV]OYP35030.1 hypothetical protein CGZ80_13570 [Rhodopirellula sp. MGV]PNY35804.1 hypothetical protein C2E31_16365 [Rhodopirellula baltica]
MVGPQAGTHSQQSDGSGQHAFTQYRAPRQHGEFLISPALSQATELLDQNRVTGNAVPSPLAELRTPARESLLRDARRYTSAYRDVDAPQASGDSIVMAGHQPTLFHPGVWFKNFALDSVAKQSGTTAVNLVVDSDVAQSSAIRVPQFDSQNQQVVATSVAYDDSGGGVPYEQSQITDRELFDHFDSNVAREVRSIVGNPLVTQLWNHAREAINRCGFAGCALAQARHHLEADLGLNTLEIPQSVVCRSEAFSQFAMHLLRDLPRFHECYNGAADFYRDAHGIRSNAHPVPNLAREDDWYEAPFWVYGNQSPKRHAVWVRATDGGNVLEISDRQSRLRRIENAQGDGAYEALHALNSPEFKVRSRALVTTMYARLILSDLFLHGIGGGKYDQLGDLISQRFWNTPTPQMMVMSATVLLPGHDDFSTAQIDRQRIDLDRSLRDVEFHGERFRDETTLSDDELQRLLETKRQLLASIPPHGQRKRWHDEITSVNDAMAKSLGSVRERLISDRSRLQQRAKDAALYCSREHSFCLYPLDYLRDAYQAMLQV